MGNGKTVLIIDDDPDILFLCRSVIEAEGFQVRTADSGDAGIELAESLQPDLVITDIMMERADAGFCVVDRLGKKFPVIMFSSITNESDQIFDEKSLPIRALFNKPVDTKKLVAKVKEILGQA